MGSTLADIPESTSSGNFRQVRDNIYRALLASYPEEEANALCRIFLSHRSGKEYYLLVAEDLLFSSIQIEWLQHAVNQALNGKPWQYILGSMTFAGLRLKVNPSVLIPRPETEELLDIAQETMRKCFPDEKKVTILDAGTGSGCIALAMKRHFPNATVYALDLSAAALDIARENAASNMLEVGFVEADLLIPPPDAIPRRLHLLISNPPYVRESERTAMQPNVLDWEPHSALFVPDKDPLMFYRSLALWGKHLLRPGGILMAEINEALGKDLVGMLNNAQYSDICITQDFRGKDRFLKAIWSGRS